MDATQRYFEIEYRHTLGRDYRAENCWHLLHDDSAPRERGGRRPTAGGVALAAVAAFVIWVLLPATVQPEPSAEAAASTPVVPAVQPVPQAQPPAPSPVA